jgi:recombination associated protein RdgC
MFFKNLTLYSIPAGWKPKLEELESQTFLPCTPSQIMSRGWTPVRNDELILTVQGQLLLTMRVEKRLLPSSVINRALEERLNKIEHDEGYRPGRKQTREIKAIVTEELIAKAFTVLADTGVWINPVNGFIGINTSSQTKADDVLSLLFKSCPDMKARPMSPVKNPGLFMENFIKGLEQPEGFTLDMDCELKGRDSKVKFVNEYMDSDSIQMQILMGKQPTKVAMTHALRLSFVLSDAMILSRLNIVELQATLVDSEEEQLEADFALMQLYYTDLIQSLVYSLGGILPVQE